jgi:hypothetical protein
VRILKILNEPNRLNRVEALIKELRTIPPSEVGSISDILIDSDLKFRESERVLLISRWAEEEPYGATQWAMRNEKGTARHLAIEEAAKALASVDPEALVQTYDVEAIGDKVPALLTALVEGWALSGKSGLDDYVFAIAGAEVRSSAEKELARVRVAELGGDGAIAWAEGINRGVRFKNHLYQEVGGEVAKLEPLVAAAWCDRVCDAPVGKWMTQEIARSWGRRDGAAMMDWLLTRPDIQETWVAGRIGFREFLIIDEPGAKAWLEKTTEEQRRSNTMRGPVGMYANLTARTDPAGALGWTEFLTDEQEQATAQVVIARRWRKNDEAAAEAWLQASSLSEFDRERARNPPGAVLNMQKDSAEEASADAKSDAGSE